ncbi:MAG: 2-oxoglutarate oxidoreductase [Thermoplasmata archaeon M9B2D]|nr:MAG: 2-oxoglutarate oxidoreductase [Thermoplasmata archaeon M9B2D]
MKTTFKRPKSLKKVPFRFCPGCGHSILHRIVAECLDELSIRERTIGIAPVGCAVFAYDYFNFDVIECPHGRPPAVATALKRVMPDRIVFSYQGDGDLAAIGLSEIIHAANRGENLTVIFVNNATYGMTGGQMAPTTLLEQKTTTTRNGRDRSLHGDPMPVSEIIATLPPVVYVARSALSNVKEIIKTKNHIKKAFQNQLDGKGFSFVEVLSPCPTDWGTTAPEALVWIEQHMKGTFKPGILKDISSN